MSPQSSGELQVLHQRRRMETFVGPLCFLLLNPLNLAPFCWFRSQSCQVEEAMMKRKVRDTESNEGDGVIHRLSFN